MLKSCSALDAMMDNQITLQSRQLHEEVLRGNVVGVLALVSYADGRLRCVRMGQAPTALPFSTQP